MANSIKRGEPPDKPSRQIGGVNINFELVNVRVSGHGLLPGLINRISMGSRGER